MRGSRPRGIGWAQTARCTNPNTGEILYEMTIYDPESFIEPWVMPARTLRLGGGDGLVPERAHCEVYETEDITNQMRH